MIRVQSARRSMLRAIIKHITAAGQGCAIVVKRMDLLNCNDRSHLLYLIYAYTHTHEID